MAAVLPLVCGQLDPHGAGVEAGDDLRVADGRVLVLAQVAAHPGDAVAAHDVVGVDHVLDAGDRRDVPADHDRRTWAKCARTMRHISRTLPTLTMIDEMPTMS